MPSITTALGVGRLLVGAGVLSAPSLARSWFGPVVEEPSAQAALRAFAVRDAALGAGLLAADRAGVGVGPWLLAGVASDAVDLAATLATPADRMGPARGATAAVAATATVVGLALFRRR